MLQSVEQLRRCTDDLGLSGEFAAEWQQLATAIKADQLDALEEERVLGDLWLTEGALPCRQQLTFLKNSSQMLEATKSEDLDEMKSTARVIEESSTLKNLAHWPQLWERSERLVESLKQG